MEELTRLAVTVALEARDRMNPHGYVAGSIAPTNRFPGGWDPSRVPPVDELAREWGDQTSILADAGSDLILIETMSAIFQLIPAVEAARATGLPVVLGVHASAEATMTSGETMQQLVAALDGRMPDAILLMCRAPQEITMTLQNLREAFDGPIGGYADIGYSRIGEGSPSQYHSIDVGANSPRRYAEIAEEWLNLGAQIIGGCCATTPEHIAALRPLVKGATV
jgi:methionine synthase I (cobalamin-dependent)